MFTASEELYWAAYAAMNATPEAKRYKLADTILRAAQENYWAAYNELHATPESLRCQQVEKAKWAAIKAHAEATGEEVSA